MDTKIQLKNRLTTAFSENQKPLLNIYFTAGYPALEDTLPVLRALQKSGVDMVEIGMPFSDPLADGPVIQRSSEIALENGMTIKGLFQQIKDMRKEIHIPVLLMGYINPVLRYGVEKFCEDAAAVGVDGVIIPDLPVREYIEDYEEIFQRNNLSNIFLVTPHTSPERLKLIDEHATGFIYAVSTDSTTGNTKDIRQQEGYFTKLKASGLKNPIMIGFNVRDKESFCFAADYANGAIIGSAFVKAITGSKNLEKDIDVFIRNIR
jgi:tryptophan synthase alpha chain